MPNAILESGSSAIQKFMYDELLPGVTKSQPPTRVNLRLAFSAFLQANGAPDSLAAEYAERWQMELETRLDRRLTDWESIGVPRPMDIAEDGGTCITWAHPKYNELTGRDPLPPSFAEVNDWIAQRSEREFLFVSVCFLKLLGADTILITDATGDGGVDLIGRLHSGPWRSTYFFVQAKSSTNLITRSVVLTEFAKFQAIKNTELFSQYARAISLYDSCDGACIYYAFLTNSEFDSGARRVAAQLGVVLRSRIQLAYWLASRTTAKALTAQEQMVGGALQCDFEVNWAARVTV